MIFLLLLSALAHAAEAPTWRPPFELQCPGGTQFRFRYLGQKQIDRTDLCFDGARSTLLAASCREGSCEALSPKVCELPLTLSPYGSEGGRLCEARGGFLQEGEFFDGSRWWEMDRCLFPADQSYVDTGLLAARWAACPR